MKGAKRNRGETQPGGVTFMMGRVAGVIRDKGVAPLTGKYLRAGPW